MNHAFPLVYSTLTACIIPDHFGCSSQPPPRSHALPKAKQLLTDAGYPNGFDAGEYFCDVSYSNLAEAVVDNLEAVGIHTKLRPLERAAFYKGYSEKSFKNLIQGSSGAFGNAATRLQAFVAKGGAYAYGNYPDLDAMFVEQADE